MSTLSTTDNNNLLHQLAAKEPAKAASAEVVYFPPFRSQEDFSNHYHRAVWYLPASEGALEKVVMGVAQGYSCKERPAHMGGGRQPVDHITTVDDVESYLDALQSAKMVLVWDAFTPELVEELQRVNKFREVLNVETDSLDSVEYGTYAKVYFRMLSPKQRKALVDDSAERFRKYAKEVKAKNYSGAVAFGTGPSIDRAFEFDFSDMFTVVCNSTVQSPAMLDHIKPDFVCAGDVVSHLGVSLYAEKFREDLEEAILDREINFLTTAQFGALLLGQLPHLKDRIFLCDQRSDLPVYDLVEKWDLPKLDSTLNIHMLPLCATFSDKTYILGCDGKNPNPSKNEDFWAHSSATQYHSLVDTGHQCHPTFDAHRQKSTFSRFLESISQSLSMGEALRNISYQSLAPSYTPALADRPLRQESIAAAPYGRVRLV